jgi:hypothetical protein
MILPTTAASDLCNFCVKNSAILPSLEAFEKGIEIPGLYYIFYDFFYKASAGDSRWKEACHDATKETDRLGSRASEAFALLVLKNNYFAWLLEAKEKLQHLVCDYDTDNQRKNLCNIVDAFLQLDFDLPEAPQEDTLPAAAVAGGAETSVVDTSQLVIVKSQDAAGFANLQKKTKAVLKAARQSTKHAAKYSEIKKRAAELQKAASESHSGDDGEELNEEARLQAEEAKGERQKKRRRLLKSFREYTVRQSQEGKFKGWSKRASDEMTSIAKRLAAQGRSDRSQMFNAAYRRVYGTRNHDKRKDEIDDEPVDYSELWDLDEGEMAAV